MHAYLDVLLVLRCSCSPLFAVVCLFDHINGHTLEADAHIALNCHFLQIMMKIYGFFSLQTKTALNHTC